MMHPVQMHLQLKEISTLSSDIFRRAYKRELSSNRNWLNAKYSSSNVRYLGSFSSVFFLSIFLYSVTCRMQIQFGITLYDLHLCTIHICTPLSISVRIERRIVNGKPNQLVRIEYEKRNLYKLYEMLCVYYGRTLCMHFASAIAINHIWFLRAFALGSPLSFEM